MGVSNVQCQIFSEALGLACLFHTSLDTASFVIVRSFLRCLETFMRHYFSSMLTNLVAAIYYFFKYARTGEVKLFISTDCFVVLSSCDLSYIDVFENHKNVGFNLLNVPYIVFKLFQKNLVLLDAREIFDLRLFFTFQFFMRYQNRFVIPPEQIVQCWNFWFVFKTDVFS